MQVKILSVTIKGTEVQGRRVGRVGMVGEEQGKRGRVCSLVRAQQVQNRWGRGAGHRERAGETQLGRRKTQNWCWRQHL